MGHDIGRSRFTKSSHSYSFLTCTCAALHVRVQLPAFVAGALDAELLLLTFLAALKVFGTKALNLAGLIVSSQLHAQRTGTHEPLTRNDAAVVTATSIVQ